MANTITSLIRDAYSALNIVSREQVSIIGAVTRDVTADRAAKDQTVRVPVAPKNSAYSISPSMTPLAEANMTYTNRTVKLDQLYGYKFHFATEEEMGLKGSGSFDTLWQQNVAQGYRTLTGQISTALNALYYNASRAYGTAGTAPFASDLSALDAMKIILDKNGAPTGNRSVVLDSKAAYNLMKLTQLTNVNQAGQTSGLSEGVINRLYGFDVKVDSNVKLHTCGAQTGEDITGGALTIGDTSIGYHGGDSGTSLVGDLIYFTAATDDPAGAPSKYVQNATISHDEASGTIVINSPGVLTAYADTTEIVRVNTGNGLAASYRANLAMSSDALVLAARAPIGQDSAVQEMIVSDPITGLTFRLAKYAGHHLVNWEMSILYGVGLGNPEHMAILVG
jgi:hypothetical protein